MSSTAAATATKDIWSNGHKPESKPDLKMIPIKDLQTSPTNPRRRISDERLETLAGSINTQGILEPLIVRKNGAKFEIVCGERRYRAASIAKFADLPCLVRELSDEQVLDIQIHENLHREDVHPMDEAYGYKVLKDKLNCDAKELALRVGRSEGYILNRLKLNFLIKEAQKDVDDEHLPLSYALEIAKYTPEIQKYIYSEVYRKTGKYQGNDYVLVPIKGETIQWKSFIEWINTNIHRLLSKAPFDTKATNLREDGLACIKCPERSGAVASLFEPVQIRKKDACLDPACYVKKAKRHVEVRKLAIAETAKIDPSEVPSVRSFSYSNGKDYLGSESATVIGAERGGSKKSCKNVVAGIDIEPDNYGKTVQVCLKATGCKVHWPGPTTGSISESGNAKSSEAEAAASLELNRARREEIWNSKVAEAVRVRVFKQAAEAFDKKFGITEVGVDLLPQLMVRFWRMTSSGDSNNLNHVVKYLLAEWGGDSMKPDGIYMPDGRSAIEQVKKLDRTMQFRILFLLIHSHKGTIGFGNNYSSQKEVRDLAAEFKVDYTLIDAEVRLQFTTKKHKDEHQAYLDAIRAKKTDAKIPRLFSEKWKAKD